MTAEIALPGGARATDDDFYEIGPIESFVIDRPRTVEIEGRTLVIVRTPSGFFSLGNRCPHQGGPICHGRITGTMLPSAANEYVYGEDGQVVRCPWHGYEFSIRTGESIAGTVRGRIPVFEIEVRDNAVFASLRRKQHHSKKTR
jgi:nitrite reductase/ring-hydroxylating ferredoxin subunit